MEIEASSQIYGDREINNIYVFIRCIHEGSIIDTVNMYTRYWMYTKATLEKMEQKVCLREISILNSVTTHRKPLLFGNLPSINTLSD